VTVASTTSASIATSHIAKGGYFEAGKEITCVVSGLQKEQLKSYLPAGEKISNSNSFIIVSDFYKYVLTLNWRI
jgi:hypothetical protein